MKSSSGILNKRGVILNKKGSAIVWAVISLLLITILAAGALVAGKSYAEQSTAANAERQAYLTARSAVNAMLAQVDGYTVSGEAGEELPYDNVLIPSVTGDSRSVTDFDFTEEMGSCQGYVRRVGEDEVELGATATAGGESRTVKAVVKREVTIEEGSSEGSSVSELFRGLYSRQLSIGRGVSVITGDGSDIYLKSIGSGDRRDALLSAGGDLYTDITPYHGAIREVKVEVAGLTVRGCPTLELPRDPGLEGPYVMLNDNTVSMVDLWAGRSLTGPLSYLLGDSRSVAGGIGVDDANGRIDRDTTLLISGNDTYAIKVRAGCTLNLNLMNNSEGDEVPVLFIFLDGRDGGRRASLTIRSIEGEAELFVCGGAGSRVTIAEDVEITGAISADILVAEADLTLNYTAPPALTIYSQSDSWSGWGHGGRWPWWPWWGRPGDGESEEPEPGETETVDIETHTWSFERYEEG
ncbi:MAG: hypothetical protein Q4C22_01930 [Bacillota bacterium]|nr:hypothetical protein [Bacillota bacterium]